MKTILQLTIFVVCFSYSIEISAQLTFQATYGGVTINDGYSVDQTTDGGYIIGGYNFSFTGGQGDVYLIKINGSGDTLWTKTFGSVSQDYSSTVQQTPDGGYIIAGSTSFGVGQMDFYLVKTDVSGNISWTKTYGRTTMDEPEALQQTSDGGYIIAGRTYSLGATQFDVLLIKTDAIGDTLWTKIYSGASTDQALSVQQTTDGGYILGGETSSFGASNGDFYLIKTDSNGDILWTKTYGGSGQEVCYSVQQTTDGGYIMAGVTNSFGAGSNDVYMVKTDGNGDTLWTKSYGGTGYDNATAVQQTTDGGYIITGSTESFGGGDKDVYLIKTNASGDTLWTKAFGGVNADEGYSVLQATDGGYVIVGHTGTAEVSLIYLIKTDANGYAGGCNEHNTSSVVSSTATQSGNGGTVSSGVSVGISTPILGNVASSENILCTGVGTGVIEGKSPLNSIQLFPNPFSDFTVMEFENYKNEKHFLTLYNSVGQLVRQIDNISTRQIRIERGNLTDGLYFFQLRSGSEIIETGKVIIE